MNLRSKLSILLLLLVNVLISQESKIYWSETGKIQRSNIDGTEIELIVDGLMDPDGIYCDLITGKIFYADYSLNKIQSANLDGTDVQDIVVDIDIPSGVDLEVMDGKIYISTWDGKIARVNIDGSDYEVIVNLPGSFLSDIVINNKEGKMYWTNSSANKIQRANLNGLNVEDVVMNLSFPYGLAIDFSNNHLYWSNLSPTGSIQKSNLDGSNIQTIISAPDINDVELYDGNLYWVQNGSILTSNLEGNGITTLVSGLTGLQYIEICERKIPIPTLSQWGIIALSMLLLIFGLIGMKQRKVIFG